MNSERHAALQAIRDALERGELTPQQIEQRLQAMIDAEIAAQDRPADTELLTLCLDLLSQLHTNGQFSYPDRREQSKAAVSSGYAKHMRRKHARGIAVKIASAAAVLVLALLGMFHQSWLNARSTPDGQQYVIFVHSVDFGATSIADHEEIITKPTLFSTPELQSALDACSFIDQLSPQPTAGLIDEQYTVLTTDTYDEFMAFFNMDGGSLHMMIRQFRDPDSEFVRVCIEQNGPGHDIRLTDNTVAYETYNTNRPVIVWYDETTVCLVTGTLDEAVCRDYAAMICAQLE